MTAVATGLAVGRSIHCADFGKSCTVATIPSSEYWSFCTECWTCCTESGSMGFAGCTASPAAGKGELTGAVTMVTYRATTAAGFKSVQAAGVGWLAVPAALAILSAEVAHLA